MTVTSSQLAYWARVDIVCAKLTDPTSTITLKFTNRPCKDGDATYLPLLQSYSGLSLAVGQDGMPRSSSGSIVINDTWNSYGENRRVYDVFDRYTPINQAVTVYEADESLEQTDIPASWTLIYTGKVQSYSKGKGSISFEVSNDLLPDIKAQYLIDGNSKIAENSISEADFDDNFTFPSSTLGKSIPLVFATDDNPSLVPAYGLNERLDPITSRKGGLYSFGAFRSPYSTSSLRPFIKDRDGNYVTASGFLGLPLLLNGTGGSAVTSHGTTEFLVPFDLDFSSTGRGMLVYAFDWKCKGQSSGGITPTGKIICNLYRTPKVDITVTSPSSNCYTFSKDIFSWELIGSGERNKSDYLTEVRGASSFDCRIYFSEPIAIGSYVNGGDILINDYYYAVGIVLSEYTNSSTTDFTSANVSASSPYYTRLYAPTTATPSYNGGWLKVSAASPSGSLYGCDVVSFTSDYENEQKTGIEILGISSQLAGAIYAQSDIDCTGLDVATYSSGTLDDSSGTITGVAFDPICRPDHVIRYLGLKHNGSTWVDGDIFDLSTYSYSTVFDGAYYRRVIGFTEGEESLLDLVSKIVTEMSCALVPLSSGKLALYPWGLTSSVSKVFTDADIIEVSDISETDLSTVINNIKIAYGRNYTGTNDQWEATGSASNASGAVTVNKDTSGDFANLLSSFNLYGNRELEETSAQFIGDATTALTRAKYLAYRHDHPHRTFTITVPRRENRTLKVMDVVDVLSVHLPAYFGTSSKAKLPTYDGEEVDIFEGEHPVQAQRRRCQIIGISNDYDAGSFPTLKIELREIKPRHLQDPTAANL